MSFIGCSSEQTLNRFGLPHQIWPIASKKMMTPTFGALTSTNNQCVSNKARTTLDAAIQLPIEGGTAALYWAHRK